MCLSYYDQDLQKGTIIAHSQPYQFHIFQLQINVSTKKCSISNKLSDAVKSITVQILWTSGIVSSGCKSKGAEWGEYTDCEFCLKIEVKSQSRSWLVDNCECGPLPAALSQHVQICPVSMQVQIYLKKFVSIFILLSQHMLDNLLLTAMAICTPVSTWPQQLTVSVGLGPQHFPHSAPSFSCPSGFGPTIFSLGLPVGLLSSGAFFCILNHRVFFFSEYVLSPTWSMTSTLSS